MNNNMIYFLPAAVNRFLYRRGRYGCELRKCNMQDERSTMQKMEDFSQAFSEFLRRPKTIFDMKDRLRLLVLLIAVIAVLEFIIYRIKNG